MKTYRYNKEIDLDSKQNRNLWSDICFYMDDDIREDLHTKLAPCSANKFLEEYLKEDERFKELLETEFDIVVK